MAYWNALMRASLLVLVPAAVTLIQVPVAWSLPRSTTQNGIEGFCNEHGGAYWPPNRNGVYGCIYDDHVIVCGGALPGCNDIPLVLKGRLTFEAVEVITGALIQKKLDNLTKQVQTLTDLVNKLVGGQRQ
jgi:hypothetical protein